jgi:WD40 repeat protein
MRIRQSVVPQTLSGSYREILEDPPLVRRERRSIQRRSMEVHRCRFVDYAPCGVQSLAWDKSGDYLAVGRSNADIEIYKASQNLVLELKISGGTDMSVESLCWIADDGNNRRLCSAGLTGLIIEWDLLTGRPKVIRSWIEALVSYGQFRLPRACRSNRFLDFSSGKRGACLSHPAEVPRMLVSRW